MERAQSCSRNVNSNWKVMQKMLLAKSNALGLLLCGSQTAEIFLADPQHQGNKMQGPDGYKILLRPWNLMEVWEL